MRAAFKEWAVVVDALGSGAQILIFRKGGIAEGPDGFQVQQREFLLFPTYFHQQREGVIASAQARFDALPHPSTPPETVKIEYFAEVKGQRHLESLSQADTLRGQHIWRDEVISNRFDWGHDMGIHVLAVRVFRLQNPVDLPMRSDYSGCKSWVQLDHDIPTAASVPVLGEKDFQDKLSAFQSALNLIPATIP